MYQVTIDCNEIAGGCSWDYVLILIFVGELNGVTILRFWRLPISSSSILDWRSTPQHLQPPPRLSSHHPERGNISRVTGTKYSSDQALPWGISVSEINDSNKSYIKCIRIVQIPIDSFLYYQNKSVALVYADDISYFHPMFSHD